MSAKTIRFFSKSTVLTTGTFLNGVIHCGKKTTPGGRIGEAPCLGLSKTLYGFGLKLGRLKTGTPARLLSNSINYSSLEIQKAISCRKTFLIFLKQLAISKFIAHNKHHKKNTRYYKKNIEKSSINAGNISGVGPRYCPSIEDKVDRFADKDSHQIFLEPEGLKSNLIYPNGISTSLPEDVQEIF